ncbi:hypothetical protein TNIN_212151 [Trichonephila inaurata madagascariensis]|uniref:Uncharacterized protein n=1 Tax=Trichonephila inaurata madagascariensis TaxID=2747483 RepID=A0A8X7BWR9_9ARAC|nr:hypothetical protein TNIN_212151 [Trichonephila inaurata madagascariensis]
MTPAFLFWSTEEDLSDPRFPPPHNGYHHMFTLEVMRSLRERLDNNSSENETPTGTSLTYQELFSKYANFQNSEKDGKITLNIIEYWLKESELLDMSKGVTQSDTYQIFSDIAEDESRLTFDKFKEFLQALASKKKMEMNDELIKKLVNARNPLIGYDSSTSDERIDPIHKSVAVKETDQYPDISKENNDVRGNDDEHKKE